MTAPARDLCFHLNRLAGTLVNGVPQLDEQGAANKWAGTTGLGLQGALQSKVGASARGLGMRRVCNILGGTTDQDPAYALSQI